MTDNNNSETPKKKVINYVTPLNPVGDNDLLVNIGAGRGAETKYGIVFPIPQDDESAKNRYNCTMKDLVRMGVQKISTSPNFASVMFENGELVDDGHAKGQALADAYKVGVRQAGGGMTAKAAKEKAIAAEKVAIKMAEQVGLSVEDVKAMIADAQASQSAETESA